MFCAMFMYFDALIHSRLQVTFLSDQTLSENNLRIIHILCEHKRVSVSTKPCRCIQLQ